MRKTLLAAVLALLCALPAIGQPTSIAANSCLCSPTTANGAAAFRSRANPVVTTETVQGPNGAAAVTGVTSELITLSTSGVTSTSVANLLPANSFVKAVTCRVTTTIATATAWKVGDGTTTGRFLATGSALTVNTTAVGLVHRSPTITTDAAGPIQIAAAPLVITTTGTPSAGAVRCSVLWETYSAPTS